MNGIQYNVELNGKLTDSYSRPKIICIICCLSKNYEKDSKRQAELQYAFKSQHHLVPILIEHDFNTQQPWLRHIVDSLVTSTIDFSEHNSTFSGACWQLHLEISKFVDDNDDFTINAVNYLNIYQECLKQGWSEIPKLFFHIPAALFHDAIAKRQPNDVTKMINLMSILNDRLNGKAQTQIDRFQQWLIHMNQTNQTSGNIESKDLNNQPQLFQKSREYDTYTTSEQV
jgi:hypothetical protein